MVRPQRQQQVMNLIESDGDDNERDESTDVSELSRSDVIQFVFENYDSMSPADIDAKFHVGPEDARNIKNAARKRRCRIFERGVRGTNSQIKKSALSNSRNTSNSISSIASAALVNDNTNSPPPSSPSLSGEILLCPDRKRHISSDTSCVHTSFGDGTNGVYNLDTMLRSFEQESSSKKAKIKIFGEPGSTAVVRTGGTEFTIKVPNGQFMEINF